MKIFVQIIQNYLKQEIPTIIITVEKQKYIFNIPTCFQRFIKDHRQRFPKGSSFFFTKATTQTLAGLSGFMLTIYQSKLCEDSKLFVSNSLYHYLEQIRYKMGFKILPYSYSNLVTNQTRTGIKSIEKVYQLLQKQDYAEIFMNSQKYIKQNLTAEEKNESKKLLDQNNEYYDGQLRIISFQIQSKGQKIMNYICKPNKLQGKVLTNKIKQLKIPPKLISKLLAQGSLKLQSGQVVTSDQIKQPDSSSPNLIILHYNSIDSIQKIKQNEKFVMYIKNQQNYTENSIYNEENIIESKQFRQFLELFSPSVKHIFYNRNYRNKDYDSSNEPITKHLQMVSFVHKYFPNCMPDVLKQHYQYIKNHIKSVKILEDIFPQKTVIAYKRCHELVLAPKKSQGYFSLQQSQKDNKQKQKKQYNAPENIIDPANIPCEIPEQYGRFKQVNPKVVFLGTGSMKPSKYRNVSCIEVEMNEFYSFILDCGEGSYYQLFNHYGYEYIDEVVMRIRTIFITHIHSDHNLGILDLIKQRNKLLRKKYYKKYSTQQQYQNILTKYKERLTLIIPYNVIPWFQSYISNIENLLEGSQILFVQTILDEKLDLSTATISKDEKFNKLDRVKSQMKDEAEESEVDDCGVLPNSGLQAYFNPIMQSLLMKYCPSQKDIFKQFKQTLFEHGIIDFQPVHVDHCPQSFAVVITHKSGIKISYSGDCRPSQQFAKAAYKSTLIIHQATFGDDLANNAVQNMHSTVGQAIDIAMLSESWKLALTHFSQRYVSAKEIVNPSLYKLDQKKRNYALNHSIVCFDHLRMRMSELPILSYQSRKICEIFPSDSQE